MKKRISLVLGLVLCMSLVGCVSQKDYDALLAEKDTLAAEAEAMSQELAQQEEENHALQIQVDELTKSLEEFQAQQEVPGKPAEGYTAEDYVKAFVAAGLPVGDYIVYTEENDVNNRLGRPGEYYSKVNFADTRMEQFDPENPQGGTVEVFHTPEDMMRRRDYVQSVLENTPMLGNQYFFESADGLALLRLEYDLTPTQAAEYEAVMKAMHGNG